MISSRLDFNPEAGRLYKPQGLRATWMTELEKHLDGIELLGGFPQLSTSADNSSKFKEASAKL